MTFPSSGSKNNSSQIGSFSPTFTLVSSVKIEATYSSEAWVNFQRTTRCYIPEDINSSDFNIFKMLKSYSCATFES
jgi:hypothetical protein